MDVDPMILSILEDVAIALALLGLFTILAYVCEEGLAPALEELSNKLELPHDVACATFLAFGSSAPEIFINSSAALSNSGTEAMYGSALISFTLIPAACVLVSENQTLTLQVVPLLRDTTFFCIGMTALLYFARNSELDTKECVMLILLFLAYLSALKILSPFYKHRQEPHHFIHPNSALDASSGQQENQKAAQAASREAKDKESGDEGKEDESRNLLTLESKVTAVPPPPPQSLPRRAYLLPPFFYRSEKDMEKAWPVVLLMSMLYVSLISGAVLRLSLAFSSKFGMPMHITGLVIVAGGSEVPDTFASMAVARTGEGPSSISATMGSQITNVLIGVGVPYLLSNVIRGIYIFVLVTLGACCTRKVTI